MVTRYDDIEQGEVLWIRPETHYLPEQPGDVPITYANIDKARRLLDYNPTTKISEGIPKFV